MPIMVEGVAYVFKWGIVRYWVGLFVLEKTEIRKLWMVQDKTNIKISEIFSQI